jgi:hypothetical protein
MGSAHRKEGEGRAEEGKKATQRKQRGKTTKTKKQTKTGIEGRAQAQGTSQPPQKRT